MNLDQRFLSITPRFDLGSIWVTPRVITLLGTIGICRILTSHATGDWGNVSSLRAKTNALALDQGYAIFSQYVESGAQVLVLTEDDRTKTWIFATARP
jgi:hypothetical protein